MHTAAFVPRSIVHIMYKSYRKFCHRRLFSNRKKLNEHEHEKRMRDRGKKKLFIKCFSYFHFWMRSACLCKFMSLTFQSDLIREIWFDLFSLDSTHCHFIYHRQSDHSVYLRKYFIQIKWDEMELHKIQWVDPTKTIINREKERERWLHKICKIEGRCYAMRWVFWSYVQYIINHSDSRWTFGSVKGLAHSCIASIWMYVHISCTYIVHWRRFKQQK